MLQNLLYGTGNQILDFRKIQNKKMKMRVQQIDLIPFIRHIMESFNSLADEHQIDFSIATQVSSLKIWADSDKLEKILFNLLSNAFQFVGIGDVAGILHIQGGKLDAESILIVRQGQEVRIVDVSGQYAKIGRAHV